MALATLQKIYTGGNGGGTGRELMNQHVNAGGSALGMSNNALLLLKNSLKALQGQAWTVQASSDASTAGHDAVDRWVDTNDLIRKTFLNDGDPFSWIVLRQTGIRSEEHTSVLQSRHRVEVRDLSRLREFGARRQSRARARDSMLTVGGLRRGKRGHRWHDDFEADGDR